MRKLIYLLSTIMLLGQLQVAAASQNDSGFTPCTDAASAAVLQGSLCKTIKLPLSYSGEHTQQADAKLKNTNVDLFVRQFSSTNKSKGAVILITGGPGESGATMYSQIATIQAGFPDFDIFIPDHRGTGFSTHICEAEEAADSAGGGYLVAAEWGTCFGSMQANAERTKQFSITNAAHDLNEIIQIIHTQNKQRPIYLYGVSYGTQLALRLFQVATPPVKGLILDSLVPIQTAGQWEITRRSHIVNAIGNKVLAQCDADLTCQQIMGAPSAEVLKQHLLQTKKKPELLAKIPGKNLKLFLGRLLDFPLLRARIPYLIKDLSNGQETELETILDQMKKSYAVFGKFPQLASSIPLVSTINGSENNLRPNLSEEQLNQEDEELLFTDAIPSLMLNMTLPQYAKDHYFGKEPKKFPRTLVFMGDMDPKTHYDGAIEHINLLRKNGGISLVTVKQAPHFIAMFAPQCFAQMTNQFLQNKLKKDQSCALR